MVDHAISYNCTFSWNCAPFRSFKSWVSEHNFSKMGGFDWVDYTVVGGTLLVSLLIGVYYAFGSKNQTQEDLLVGGRSMGVIPIACSMLVTYLSAIQILGYPAEVYGYGTQIFMNSIVVIITVPPSIYFFMVVFYKMQLTSVYEYLEYRFESRFIRRFASFIFMLQMAMFMGVGLFAPSIALNTFIGLELWQSVVGLGLCATVYTAIGGIKAVVWTDVFQLVMILLGMVAILYRGFATAGGFAQAFEIAQQHGRLEVFDFTIDPFMRHNTLNMFLGTGFACFCLYGTHQPQVQRYCSLPSLKQAILATVYSLPMHVVTTGFCIIAGVAIFSSYAGCDPMATGEINRVDAIVPHFVSKELTIPGMMGLFTACVFSATLSTLSSGLNSLAAVLYEDFLVQHERIRKMSPAGQGHLIRFVACMFGLLCIGLAFGAQHMGSILAATITAMGALSGPLGAIFAMGLLMPCVNRYGAIWGMTTGFICMIWITINAFMLGKSHIPLPFSADDCSHLLYNATAHSVSLPDTEPLEWPEKIYTISYTLYSFMGGMITFAVSIVVSVLTGGCSARNRIDDRYLHPLLHRKKAVPQQKAVIIRTGSIDSKLDCISSSLNDTKSAAYQKIGHIMIAKTLIGGPTAAERRNGHVIGTSKVPHKPQEP